MSEFNREQIIKALECCTSSRCKECAYFLGNGRCKSRQMQKDALALVKEQEQKNFELENRLKECENGYEGTLYLDRCKLQDAEKRIVSQREEIRRLQNRIHNLTQSRNAHREKAKRLGVQLREDINDKKALDEENERLRAEKETLEIYNADYKFKNKELMAFNRRWAKECADLQDECETIKADTVRKMQERLMQEERIFEAYGTRWKIIYSSAIDQIAKEMLGGE